MMNLASLASLALRALFLSLVLAATACEARDSTPTPADLPATLLGAWQVSDVRLDRGDTNPWAYKLNVHKYLGRTFVFAPERLTYNMPRWKGSQQVCETPKVEVHRTTALKVVSASLCSRPFQPVRPSPKDFGLPLSDSSLVKALSLICSNDKENRDALGGCQDTPHTDEIRGAWFIVLNPDEIALRWEEELFLILKRLPQDAKPVASFDCAKAATETEKTICSSVSLAAFDVSVAGSYKHVLGYYDFALRTYDPSIKPQTVKQLAAFKQSQREWLKTRDKCGGDVACLEQAMGERILGITDEYLNYAYDNRDYDIRLWGDNFGKSYAERRW